MTERRVLIVIIAVLSAFIVYDRYTRGRHEEALVERQRDIEVRTITEVKKAETKAAEQRVQSETDLRAHELELKKLELEIKRAEADSAAAVAKQKEIDAREAQKKHANELAEQSAERARMDAETAREENKREQSRKRSQEIRAATNDRLDASRRLNDLAWKKQTAERLVIAWRNKLEGAQHSKEKSLIDGANAQSQPTGASVAQTQQRRSYDPLDGPSPASQDDSNSIQSKKKSGGAGPTVTWITSNRDAVENAQAQQAGAEKAIAEATAALAKAQADLARITLDYESALSAKQSADRRMALVAPPQTTQNRAFATYAMVDGRKLEAFCVIESGEDLWVKTGAGIETIKRGDVEAILHPEDEAESKN